MTTRTNASASKSVTARAARPPLTNEMAARYLPQVQRHAARIARRLPKHVQVGDLVSAGCCGLLDAFMKYDPARMESFDAYVDHRIRGAILDELRSSDPLTRDQRAFAKRVSSARQRLAGRDGGTPGEQELARELGLTLAQYRRQAERLHATSARTEAMPFSEEDDAPAEPANDAPENLVSSKEERARIQGAMGHLAPRLREVLRLYYTEGRTLREVGLALGVTESRVSQVHGEALARLREVLATMEV